MTRTTVLIAIDDGPLREELASRLDHEYRILQAASAEEAGKFLRREQVEAVIADHRLPGATGLDFLREVRDRHPGVARLMLAGRLSVDLVIRAIGEGEVHRFLVKPVDGDELEIAVFCALERMHLERENRHLRALLGIGRGPARGEGPDQELPPLVLDG